MTSSIDQAITNAIARTAPQQQKTLIAFTAAKPIQAISSMLNT
jgi:hypothetical protein